MPHVEFPIGQDARGNLTAGQALVVFDKAAQMRLVLGRKPLDLDGFSVQTAISIRFEAIEQIQHPTAEASSTVPADVLYILSQDDDGATRHVFASIIPDPLDHR